MYKYENIKKVLTYLSSVVLEEENEATLIKWALQGYSANVRNINTTDDILFGLIKLTDHKGTIPTGFKKILEVGYTQGLPNEFISNSNTQFLQPTIDGEKLILFQRVYYQYFKPYSTYMRYVGQNSQIFDNNCINLLCDCQTNFSISKDLSTITTDSEDGYATILYTAPVMLDGEYLVPDNANLWQALAYFITSCHFRDRYMRKEEGTQNMFIENLRMANNLFQTFQKEDLFKKFDPDAYVEATILPRQVAQISNQMDYYNFKRI